jgi:hypothetical protein
VLRMQWSHRLGKKHRSAWHACTGQELSTRGLTAIDPEGAAGARNCALLWLELRGAPEQQRGRAEHVVLPNMSPSCLRMPFAAAAVVGSTGTTADAKCSASCTELHL